MSGPERGGAGAGGDTPDLERSAERGGSPERGAAAGRGGSPERGAAGGRGASPEASPLAAVSGLSHVAIATREADALAATLAGALGAVRGHEEILDGGALRVLFLQLGPVTFELLEPRAADHTVAKFLEARGPGLHHVSLEVPDVALALERCRAAGLRLVDAEPREGADGTLVAFLHPRSLGGVLVELCQPGKPTM